NYTFKELKHIFKTSYIRKQAGYQRIIGYTRIDQCRRKFLLEFFGESPNQSNECCDNDSDLSKIECYNRKKVKRQFTFNEKIKNLFRV
ncbi:MAG: RecQ family zinc-binding domain-containing protein, partial [Staphylococcus sp.]|nr:RecQ family zinc-binding domain-containing protein [Staphylococcus sp.]